MKKIVFILIIILFCCGKSYSQDGFSIVQKESHLPIKIGADTTTNWVFNIGFPLVFEITNNTLDTMRFVSTNYLCNPLSIRERNRGWSAGGATYNYTNGELDWLKMRHPARLFKGECSKTYVLFAGHSPSNDSLQQVIFAPYLQRMREEKVTILEIESIQELKEKKSKLIDIFLKGDSINFSFRDKYFFYNEIIPVEVK